MALIGLNGYSGVGKDLVGSIIQELCPDMNWKIKKFAGKLKDVAEILTGIPKIMFEDQEFKKINLPDEWRIHGMPMTIREFLQKLGTDALRNGLHDDVWVNALISDYRGIGWEPEDISNWIITDTRFPNEAQIIKNKGGIIIRIDRPGVKPINNHPSEIALDNWNFDYKIANVSDIKALTFTVETILKDYNML